MNRREGKICPRDGWVGTDESSGTGRSCLVPEVRGHSPDRRWLAGPQCTAQEEMLRGAGSWDSENCDKEIFRADES